MPSIVQVEKIVREDLARYTGFPEDKITPDLVLANPPLSISDPAWNSVTLALRAYVQLYAPSNTLLLSEVKKKDQTVKGLTDIVSSRTPRI